MNFTNTTFTWVVHESCLLPQQSLFFSMVFSYHEENYFSYIPEFSNYMTRSLLFCFYSFRKFVFLIAIRTVLKKFLYLNYFKSKSNDLFASSYDWKIVTSLILILMFILLLLKRQFLVYFFSMSLLIS